MGVKVHVCYLLQKLQFMDGKCPFPPFHTVSIGESTVPAHRQVQIPQVFRFQQQWFFIQLYKRLFSTEPFVCFSAGKAIAVSQKHQLGMGSFCSRQKMVHFSSAGQVFCFLTHPSDLHRILPSFRTWVSYMVFYFSFSQPNKKRPPRDSDLIRHFPDWGNQVAWKRSPTRKVLISHSHDLIPPPQENYYGLGAPRTSTTHTVFCWSRCIVGAPSGKHALCTFRQMSVTIRSPFQALLPHYEGQKMSKKAKATHLPPGAGVLCTGL